MLALIFLQNRCRLSVKCYLLPYCAGALAAASTGRNSRLPKRAMERMKGPPFFHDPPAARQAERDQVRQSAHSRQALIRRSAIKAVSCR